MTEPLTIEEEGMLDALDEAEETIEALVNCVGLLTPEASDRFWHNWLTHPFLDGFMEREERLAALAAWREARA